MTKWVRMSTVIVGVLIMGFSACGDDNPASSETINLTIINAWGLTRFILYTCPHQGQIHGDETDWGQTMFSVLRKG